jgi:phage baseplate assembly protein W
MNKYFNISFPIQDDVENNRLFAMNKNMKDAVKTELLMLLLTERGERWYNPDYGTSLRKFLFEMGDQITDDLIVDDIKSSVSKFLPRITVSTIGVEPINNNTRLIITIKFTYGQGYFSGEDEVKVTIS